MADQFQSPRTYGRPTRVRPIVRPSRLLPRLILPPQRARARWLRPIFAVLIVIVVLVRLASALTADSEVPEELIGRWVTDEPSYAGRAFILAQHGLAFQVGFARASTYSVRRIQRRDSPGLTEYTITGYSSVDGEIIQSLQFHRESQRIGLKNPEGILWTRVP